MKRHLAPRPSSAVETLEPRRLLAGLTGQYFDRVDFASVVTTRTDATVDFTWAGAPAAGVGADRFSVRWTGQVEAQHDEVYAFHTLADDGVRLWVDGRLLVDNWQNQGPTERSGSVALEAGKRYDLRMDHYDFDLGARARLQWSSASTPKQTIPAARLFAAPSGVTATYYEDRDFTGPRTTRVEPNLNLAWPTGQPATLAAGDGFAARFSGHLVPAFDETYTFRVAGDVATSAVLRVDGRRVVDTGSPVDDGRIRLEAGKRYAFTLDYADPGGPASVRLDWQSPSRPLQAVPADRLFAAAPTSVPAARTTYSNPTLDIDAPDPSIIRADGAYWMTHTMGGPDIGWPLWRSTDMVNWSFRKHLLTVANKPSWMARDFWAPEIHLVGDRYVMTGTATDARTNRLTIVMASSDRVDGDYVVSPEPIVSRSMPVLDSNLFTDDDGTRHLLWKADSPTVPGGTFGSIRIRQLDASGMAFAPGSAEVEILDNLNAGWERNLAEAPWLVRRADAYYLFYSGARIDTSYAVGVARSTSLTQMFQRNPANPIIGNNAAWAGPGHGGFALDNDGGLWHLYHARRAADPDAGRKQVLDEVRWNGTQFPTFDGNGVSSTPRPGPLVDAPSGAGVVSLSGTGIADVFRVGRSAANSSTLEVRLNGALLRSLPADQVQRLTIDAGGGDDRLELDFTRGDAIPGGGIDFAGGVGAADDVTVIDPDGIASARFLGAGRVASGSGLLTATGVERFTVIGGTHRAAADLAGAALDVRAGRVTFAADQRLATLTIGAGAAAALEAGGRAVVATSLQLATGGRLDVSDGAIVVNYAAGAASPIVGVVAALRTGRAGGTWDGPAGIVSSAAAGTSGFALGVGEASALAAGTIPRVTLDASAVVVRATLAGDANLDRTVSFSDLVILAQNYGTTGRTFGDGDFNYSADGAVGFDDLVALAQRYGATYTPAAVATTTRPRREGVGRRDGIV